MKIYLLLFIAFFSALSCTKKGKVENVERAFYYWKSDDSYLSQDELKELDSQNVQKIYVKFFEIEHNDVLGNYPISKTNFSSRFSDYCNTEEKNYQIIPTIYIQNSVFQKSSDQDLDVLADNTNFLIGKYLTEKMDSTAVSEIQIDCDWTPSSKDQYFKFLKKFKKVSQKEISVTLRLYPYKFPDKMGVPPADRAMLMCYNLINPLADKSKNSILDLEELKKYVEGSKKYPLHLDIALPIYSWMQVYKNNQFSGVLYDTSDIKPVLKEIKPMWYEVTKDTVINYQTYLKAGDKIKYESIDAEKITKAIEIIKKNLILDKNITVSLFSLDESQLKQFKNEEITAFYNHFMQ